MPVVDEDDKEIDVTEKWSLQTEHDQLRTNQLVEVWREELEDEYGSFTVRNLASGRVLMEAPMQEPYVLYLSDPKDPDPFLCVDDFTPEIWPEWWPKDKRPTA